MTPRRSAVRLAAAGTAASIVLLTGTPAVAAEPVARASATAIELTIGGAPVDSGTYTATHDGKRRSSTGTDTPAISALTGQSFLQAGTLAQQATTRIEGRNGASAACSGLAGDGAVLVEAGEGSCLRPGENLELTAANLDLSDVRLVESDLLQGLDQQLQDALAPVLTPLLSGLQGALQQVLTQADLALVLDLGAIQSFCVARPGTATGDSTLVGAGASLRLLGQEVTLLDLPADPEPNTTLLTDLGQVVDLVLQALRTQFTGALESALGPLADVIDQAAVLTNALGTVGEQLAPLEENLLDVTLNKQERPRKGEIAVTALDLRVLPVAADFGVEVLSAEIGRSTCGPNGRVQPEEPAEPEAPAPDPQPKDPQVPISVPAGSTDSGLGAGSLLAIVLLAAGAGAASVRRSLRS